MFPNDAKKLGNFPDKVKKVNMDCIYNMVSVLVFKYLKHIFTEQKNCEMLSTLDQ